MAKERGKFGRSLNPRGDKALTVALPSEPIYILPRCKLPLLRLNGVCGDR